MVLDKDIRALLYNMAAKINENVTDESTWSQANGDTYNRGVIEGISQVMMEILIETGINNDGR